MKYNFNELNINTIQIYGEVQGMMTRNENGNDNANKFDFFYKYFNSKKQLVKIRGVCRSKEHLKEKIEKELKNNF